jgi:hypothetical protein
MLLMTSSVRTHSDEGMWLYNAPPRRLLRERHHFEPTAEWLEHVQNASVRFNSGGSGSFVSADGLIISNHHVGAHDLEKLSDEKHDYLRHGFYARTRAEERRCLDLELNVLVSIEDVTARVNQAVKAGQPADEAFAARRAATAAIEKESLDQTGLRSDVVTLYQGGQYHLYRYKRYTDVRVVFAPEQQIAFFGGDPDNFEYPRYDLDICLFRAYENGQPAKIEHYLKWSTQGVSENELIFVSGNPGRTSRQLTLTELEGMRDRDFPLTLERLHRMEVLLTSWSGRSDENARRAKELLFGVQNSRKARQGGFEGLLDPNLMAGKAAAEKKLREAVAGQEALKGTLAAWEEIADARRVMQPVSLDSALLEGGQAFSSTLFRHARTLLRSATEKTKPNGERLREFRDSNRASLELALFSPEPIYDDLETIRLADSLTWLVEKKGWKDSLVQEILAGKSPRSRASELVLGTKVKDVAFRKQLYAGGPAEVSAAHDPMIELARLVDLEARRLRKLGETQDERTRQAYARIAAARFAIEGTNVYPDATFTLRLALGVVKGYQEDGHAIPFQTTMAGLYGRSGEHHGRPPFDLPARWVARKSKLNLSTPLNFVSTADIIGGNSGSPVVNRNGEFVGIIFDGNLQSLVLDFLYTEEQARALAVNSQGILEALKKVYDAKPLAEELVRGKLR